MAPKAGRVCTCPMPIFYIAELMLVHTNQLSFSTVWAPKKDIYPVNKEQATTERGRFDELVPRTFPIFIGNRSSDSIWGNGNWKGTIKIWLYTQFFRSKIWKKFAFISL